MVVVPRILPSPINTVSGPGMSADISAPTHDRSSWTSHKALTVRYVSSFKPLVLVS